MTQLFGGADTNIVFAMPPAGRISFIIMGHTNQTVTEQRNSPSPDYPAPITGTTALTVSDGGSNSKIVTLPQPLYSLPDGSYDTYVCTTNPFGPHSNSYLYKMTGYKVLNENSLCNVVWAETTNTIAFIFWDDSIAEDDYNLFGYCDKFPVYPRFNSDGSSYATQDCEGCFLGGYVAIRILKSRLSGWSESWTDSEKVTAFKNWLSSNPVTILYKLAAQQYISGEPMEPFAWPYREVKVTADGGMVILYAYINWSGSKTNWTANDYFNLDPDYNRIKGNIEYIKEFSEVMYKKFSIIKMGNFTIDGFPTDTFLNNIVDNVSALENNLFKPPADQPMVRYTLGQLSWDAEQLNIIEGNILRLFSSMVEQWNCIPQMAFTMGTGVDEF